MVTLTLTLFVDFQGLIADNPALPSLAVSCYSLNESYYTYTYTLSDLFNKMNPENKSLST